MKGSTILKIGLIAGVAAGMMMAMWQMGIGAATTEESAVPGVDSSVWSAVTSIPSFIFGEQWFHSGFDFWAIVFGLVMHMGMSMMIGVLGVTLLIATQGARPHPIGGLMQGAFFGVVLEVVLINLFINPIQDVNTVYTSTPEWSWWIAHGIYGMTLGVVAVVLLRGAPIRLPAIGRQQPA